MPCRELVLSAASWRLPSGGGDAWSASVMPSSLAGATPLGYEHKARVVTAVGPRKLWDMTPGRFGFVQDLYASRFTAYDKLRERYRRKIKENPITSTAQIPLGYNGVAGGLRGISSGALSQEEENWLKMNGRAWRVDRATINDRTFCTVSYCKPFKYDNSVIKQRYFDRGEGEWLAAYAWIQRLLVHEQYPGGPAAVIVEGEWLEVLDEKGPTGLTRVQRNMNHNFNLNCMYVFLADCEPVSVALLSERPDDEDCDVFNVVDTSARIKS